MALAMSRLESLPSSLPFCCSYGALSPRWCRSQGTATERRGYSTRTRNRLAIDLEGDRVARVIWRTSCAAILFDLLKERKRGAGENDCDVLRRWCSWFPWSPVSTPT